jgi:putative spermidine/putrescine transport system permease protein
VSIPVSLTPNTYLSLPTTAISSRHYGALLTSEAWLRSIWQSGVIALISATIATFLGTLAVIGMWRMSSRFSEIIRAVLIVPLIVPPIVSALAFYRMWVDLGWVDTYVGTIAAHAILGLPFVVVCVSSSIANLDPRLEQASRSLGASMRQTIIHVILPTLKPGVAAGALFAFVTSWDEVVVTIFITTLHIYTVPRRIWESLRWDVDPIVAAIAALLLIPTVGTILFHQRWNRPSRRRETSERAP